jgi:hypothetical protein
MKNSYNSYKRDPEYNKKKKDAATQWTLWLNLPHLPENHHSLYQQGPQAPKPPGGNNCCISHPEQETIAPYPAVPSRPPTGESLSYQI